MAGAAFLSAAAADPVFLAPAAQVGDVTSAGAVARLSAAPGSPVPPQGLGVSAGAAGLAVAAVGAAALASSSLRRQKAGLVRAARATSTARRAFEDELGVQPPTGFWDPAGFTSDGDQFDFYRRRCVEIKHGRVSMLACIGYIVPEYARFPGYLSPSQELKFTDVPNGLAAFSKVPLLGWLQILFFCGALERTGFTLTKDAGIGFMQDASMKGEPGNYGLGFIGAFNTIPSEPAQRVRKLNAELANGRLAMVAILGMLFQNGTLGTTGPEMWGFEVTLDAVEER
mmetsp:Transcript_54313/g.170731  ORF Transcript_54313/g.170731 Transcript_54313/m.170731 type:complete len:284 (+) Transcript_54313:83-934(+)